MVPGDNRCETGLHNVRFSISVGNRLRNEKICRKRTNRN